MELYDDEKLYSDLIVDLPLHEDVKISSKKRDKEQKMIKMQNFDFYNCLASRENDKLRKGQEPGDGSISAPESSRGE